MDITGKSEGILTPRDITVTENGEEIKGISGMTITIQPDEPVFAEMMVYMDEIKLMGVAPRYMCMHPVTGEIDQVVQITFKNGETWCAS
jgi:hypothetical protein